MPYFINMLRCLKSSLTRESRHKKPEDEVPLIRKYRKLDDGSYSFRGSNDKIEKCPWCGKKYHHGRAEFEVCQMREAKSKGPAAVERLLHQWGLCG